MIQISPEYRAFSWMDMIGRRLEIKCLQDAICTITYAIDLDNPKDTFILDVDRTTLSINQDQDKTQAP